MGTTQRLGLLRVARALIEVGALTAAFVSAFVYRFAFPIPTEYVDNMLALLVPVVLLEIIALRIIGASRHSWRYTSLDDVVDVGVALTGVTLLLMVVRFTPATPDLLTPSLGVIMANWVTSIAALISVRMLRRLQSERLEAHRRASGVIPRRRVLLVGAGRAGVMVAKEIAQRPELGMVPVGFVDDDPAKARRRVAGLEVLGTTDDLALLAQSTGADEAILTMASVDRSNIRRIVDTCEAAGLETKIIPGLFEIVGAQVNLNRIRPVSVEDLLGRDPVDLDPTSLHELLGGRTVMITGAGGSIGSELARQAARFGPRSIVLAERSEPALWAIHRELSEAYPGLHLPACVADVCDQARMRRIFEEHDPHVVVHAAAHKHVPMMEMAPGEAVKNNVGGTRVVVDLAAEFAAEQFVLVSTDKAVNPTSVMGATKRLAERYVQHVAAKSGLNFVAVRFGNVLGSTGSVVPIFEEQVQAGGPVTVTHPDMVRYFMTIPEASGLVLQAAALGRSGEILVLDMGEPVRIVDLAENVIRLSGFEPGRDIPIEFTGLRPGEKLFEELSLSEETAQATRHPKVWIGATEQPEWDTAEGDIAALLRAADHSRYEVVRSLLRWLVPEFTGVPDDTDSRPGDAHVGTPYRLPTEDPRVTDDLPPIRIFLSPPDVGEDERKLLLDAFDSNWIAPLGPHVDAFETEMAAYLGQPVHAVALSSGTAALYLALLDLGVGPGDEVVTSTMTFAATVNAISYVGATPVLIDVDPTTWQMDPNLVAEAIGERAAAGQPPAAVVTVDLYGICADHTAIRRVCDEHGIPIIEDAAEALGTADDGRPAGTFGDVGVFSFNGNKIITTSGGGMLLTGDPDRADRIRNLATQARDPAPHYEHSQVGYNYRLSNLLAAVGRGQLASLDAKVAARREVNARYRQLLADVPGVTFLDEPDGQHWNHWLTCLAIDPRAFGADHHEVVAHLRRLGIEARPVWKPMHLQPVWAHVRAVGGEVAARLFRDGLCLPSGSALTPDQQHEVVAGMLAVR